MTQNVASMRTGPLSRTIARPSSMLLGLAMVLLSGPVLMLATFWVTRWVIRGLLARRAR